MSSKVTTASPVLIHFSLASWPMVGVAQLVEHRVVVARVAGSSPVAHPIKVKAPNEAVGGLCRVYRHVPRTCWLTWALKRLSATKERA